MNTTGGSATRSATASATGAQILVVEDDPKLRHVVALALEIEGYRVIDANTGQGAIGQVRTRNPDVILLDLGLPDGDGLALIPLIRASTAAAIIVVSGRENESDKIKALDSGANDYLTKPFSVAEFRARIRVALRWRARIGDSAETVLSFGDYRLDLQARKLFRERRRVALSATEFRLLASLARHADQVVTTMALLKETWGVAYQRKADYVRVYMHSLRRKLEDDPARPHYLLNEPGLGYRLRTTNGE